MSIAPYIVGSIASAISTQGVTLQAHALVTPKAEEPDPAEEEFRQMMALRKALQENPNWMEHMEKEMNAEDGSTAPNTSQSKGNETKPALRTRDEEQRNISHVQKEDRKQERSDDSDQEENIKRKRKSRHRKNRGRKRAVAETVTEPSQEKRVKSTEENEPMTKKKKQATEKILAEYTDLVAAESRSVYLGNLSFDITKKDLLQGLKGFGSIEQVYVMKNNKGRGSGFAYATFQDASHAGQAIKATGLEVSSRPMRISAFERQCLYKRTGKRKKKKMGKKK